MARRKKAKVAAAEPEETQEPQDESRAGSLRRLAKAFREASVWDNHIIADFFDDEADLLDPPKEEEEAEE
jgi:hypothetical protein